jgi:hypothetical protein
MKWLMFFEDFQGSKYNIDDIIKCITGDGKIYATIIQDFPNNDPEEPLRPISVQDDGKITIDLDENTYEVDIKDVNKIDFGKDDAS